MRKILWIHVFLSERLQVGEALKLPKAVLCEFFSKNWQMAFGKADSVFYETED